MAQSTRICPSCLVEYSATANEEYCRDCGFELIETAPDIFEHEALLEILKLMPMSTISEFPGHLIVQNLGMVTGSTVRTRHVGSRFDAEITQNFGGELSGYTNLLIDARQEALAECVTRQKIWEQTQ